MNDPHKHNWVGSIETHSGIKFDIENPTPEMVSLEDISWSLSMTCRYNGQIPSFYSVAEHSCLVADWLATNGHEHLAFAGLMHDAAEAYIGDIVRPMKLIPEFAVIYNEFERLVETAIGEKFNVDLYPIDPIVKEADKAIYEWEVENIRSGKMQGLPPTEAHNTFMSFFNHYQPKHNFTRESQMEYNKPITDMTDAEIDAETEIVYGDEVLSPEAQAKLMRDIADLDAAAADDGFNMEDTLSKIAAEGIDWNDVAEATKPLSPRRELLMGAADLVDGDRNAQYGDPRQDFRRTAGYWNIHINGIIERKLAENNGQFGGDILDPHDVAIMMDLLKTSRLAWSPDKEDTWMDKAGYTACGWHCVMPEE